MATNIPEVREALDGFFASGRALLKKDGGEALLAYHFRKGAQAWKKTLRPLTIRTQVAIRGARTRSPMTREQVAKVWATYFRNPYQHNQAIGESLNVTDARVSEVISGRRHMDKLTPDQLAVIEAERDVLARFNALVQRLPRAEQTALIEDWTATARSRLSTEAVDPKAVLAFIERIEKDVE